MKRTLFNKIGENQKGSSLIEIIIAMAILAILVGPFLSLYVYAVKANVRAEKMVDTTYIAQQSMEQLYGLSATSATTLFSNTQAALITDGYTEINLSPVFQYKKEVNDFYVLIEIDTAAYSGNLHKVVVEVYYDVGYTELATKMEHILTWE